jgi:hypothetical protein
MRTLVDKLTAELSRHYAQRLETLLVDLRMEEDRVELWVGFSLRSDHILRHLIFPVNTEPGACEAASVVRAVFQNIQTSIDAALA